MRIIRGDEDGTAGLATAETGLVEVLMIAIVVGDEEMETKSGAAAQDIDPGRAQHQPCPRRVNAMNDPF
jgi:hypothetical protein